MTRARRLVCVAAWVLAAASPASADPMPAPPVLPSPEPSISFSGGNGAACREAVVIRGAQHEKDGVRAERWWVFTKNVGAKIAGQRVAEERGKAFETVDLLMPDGTHSSLCFDITSFYGKP